MEDLIAVASLTGLDVLDGDTRLGGQESVILTVPLNSEILYHIQVAISMYP